MNGSADRSHGGLIGLPIGDTESLSVRRMIEDMAEAITRGGLARVHLFGDSFVDWAGLAPRGVTSVICLGGFFISALRMVPFLRGIDVALVCLDHPLYHVDAFAQFQAEHAGRTVFTFPSSSNLAFARRFIPGADLRCVRHAASLAPALPPGARRDRIAFIGNYSSADSVRMEFARDNPAHLPRFDRAAACLKMRQTTTIEDAVAPCFADPYRREKRPFLQLCHALDRYLRAGARERALRSLDGLPVDLIGAGWEQIDLPPSTRFLGPRQAPEVLAAIAAAKIVVNTTPAYYESHERMFQAAAAGAALVTARNDLTEALFAGCGALYDYEDEIGELCAALLKDAPALEAKASKGRQIIAALGGWSSTANEVMRALQPEAPAHPGILANIDLRSRQPSLNLSLPDLQAATAILICAMIDQTARIAQLMLQIGPYLATNACIFILVQDGVALGGFVDVAQFLETRGFPCLDVTYTPVFGILTVRKCDDLAPEDRRCSFQFGERIISLTYPSGRDIRRRAPLHLRTFHEVELLDHLETVGKLGLFIDIGANIGNHAVYAAAKLGRMVIAYEPDPQDFACLETNIRSNGLGDLIKAHNHHVPSLDAQHLDGQDHIAILRVDAGGKEADVLSGAADLLRNDRPIVFARSESNDATTALTALMAKQGYECRGKVGSTQMLEFLPLDTM